MARAGQRRFPVDVIDYEEEDDIPCRRDSRPFTAEDDDDAEEWVTRPRRPLRTYDFDADDEEEYQPPEEALLHGLRRTESCRHSLESERANLQALLRNNPQLAAKWQEFAAGGGISADDFEAFLNGKFRVRLGARTRRHLRLITNRRPPRIRLRRRQNDDPPDEAA